MSPFKLLLIALGLASDAFAVSIAEGIAIGEGSRRHTLRVSVTFGLFQGAMPVLGWLAGHSMRLTIAAFDHWVAFGLLDAAFGIGSSTRQGESRAPRLLMLALATSIDAFAMGLTIAMLRVRIWTPAVVIGLVTAVLCAAGVQAGNRIGTRLGRIAQGFGGVILLGLGLKILADHLL